MHLKTNVPLYRNWEIQSLILSILVALTGFFVLIGWIFNISVLKSISPEWVSMKVNTAICFLLAGLSLTLLNLKKTKSVFNLTKALTLIMLIIGLVSLLEFIFNFNAGIDEIFFMDDTIIIGNGRQGRMAPGTAICFILFGISLIFSKVNSFSQSIFQCLNLCAGTIALFAIICYLFGVKQLTGVSENTAMALHTSLALFLMMPASLFLQPDKGIMKLITSNTNGGKLFRNLFPLLIFIIIIIGWLHFKVKTAGLFDSTLTISLYILSIIIAFAIVLYVNSKIITKSDEERSQFFKFFQISSDIMVIADPNGCFKKVNPACMQLLGFRESDLLCKPFIDFVYPEDRDSTLEEMEKQINTGSSINFENRYLCKDGTIRWLSWKANYIKEEGITYATARDITERKQAEKEILRSNERYNLVSKATHDSIWDMNILTGEVNRSGEGFKMLFGYNQEQYNNDHFHYTNLIHPDDLSRVKESMELAHKNPDEHYWEVDYRFLKANGTYAYVHDKGYIIRDKKGRAVRMIGATQDMTETVNHIKAIEERNRQLQEIAWTQSHIVRAPLARLIGLVNLLDFEGQVNEETNQLLKYTLTSAQELDGVIKSIVMNTQESEDN